MTTYTLSAAQAGQLATRVRLLRRQRRLTAHQAALADVLLWSARKPGSGLLTASLGTLARLAGQGRRTAVRAIARLVELGLVRRIRRRVRVAWGGSVASRQIANTYILVAADTGCQRGTGREEPSVISIAETPIAAVKAAQEALREVARRRAKTMIFKSPT